MSLLEPPPDITKHKVYALIILVATILAAVAQALVVPPSWLTLWATQSQNKETIKDPAPVEASPSAPPITTQNVYGVWLSEKSKKKYQFIYHDQNTFVIYEVGDRVLNEVGSGKIDADGSIEADILAKKKGRKAHFRLKLSPDGKKIDGSWKGDDPRESGSIVFVKI